MEEILITGASGFIGSYLKEKLLGASSITHQDIDLTDWNQLQDLSWNGKTIINCAHVGIYGNDELGSLEKNIILISNLRRKWPKAKIISFGSGAMYDKSLPIVMAKEYDRPVYPSDLYGLSKRVTVDMSDITLIPFGICAKTRFVKAALDCVQSGSVLNIYQDMLYSWINLIDIPNVIDWAITAPSGRYNLCGYKMLLSEMARFLGVKNFTIEKSGLGNEYTGRSNVNLNLGLCPSF